MVDDILDRRGITPLKLGSAFVASGYRVISAKAIKGRRVDLSVDEPRFVNEATYRRWMRTPLLADDVILTSEAPLGEPAYIAHAPEWCLGQRLFGIRTKKAKLNGRFLFYALQAEQVRHDLLSRATGTTAQGIRQTELRRVRIPLPAVDEQRAIANILGALDDKLAVNRRINETLEATARALFRSWFVDFDPVRTKCEGGNLRLPRRIADLFPARLIDSELDEIPEGWKVGTFGDHVEVLRDQENPLECPDAVFRHFSLPAFDEGRWPKEELGESIKSLKFRVPAGSVLLSKLNPEIDRVWLVDVQPSDRAVCSTEFLVLRARPPAGRAFTYCFARSPVFRRQIEGLVTGTSKSHQRAQVGSVLGIAAIRPPSALVEAFEQTVDPLLRRTLNCLRESRTLAGLRDLLLPQLISGSLRVKDVDRFVKRSIS
ncbi:MAG: restriction endonuclease subunit S [Planctomycetota bacterium]